MPTELVMVVSDISIPFKSPDIDSQFKSILVPNKINHLLCLGNIGNQDTLYWLQNLSSNFQAVKGEFDINQNYPEKKSVQIGSFKIGMIHGHQVLPAGDIEALSNIQRELDCDILLSGFTHKYNVSIYDNKLFLNPGSITGSLSPMMEDSVPSFILMAISDDELTIYSYVLNDRNDKFQVGQLEYKKGDNELKIVKEIKFDEEEEEVDNKENINEEKKEENNIENNRERKEEKKEENNIENKEEKNEDNNNIEKKEENNNIENSENNINNDNNIEEKPKEENNININNNENNEQENNTEGIILENKPQIESQNQEVKEEEKNEINENEIKTDNIEE